MATQMTFDNLAQNILAVHHIDRQVITKKSDTIGLFDRLSKKVRCFLSNSKLNIIDIIQRLFF